MPALRKTSFTRNVPLNGLYIHSSPPRVLQIGSNQIKQIIRNGDIDKLEQLVYEGHGKKLIGEYSADYKTRTFLKSVPNLMSKINLMHDAVNGGKLDELQAILDEFPSKNKKIVLAKDESGVGLLHKAVYNDIEDIYKWLIEKYPNAVLQKDSEGRTPFHYTVTCRNPTAVQKLLINAGADSSVLDNRQHSAKYYMAHTEEIELPSLQSSISSSRKSTGNRDGLNFKKSNIRIWIHQRNLTNLQQVVWEGNGSKLLVEHSNNAKIKRFLEAVPHIMGLIKDIHSDVVNDELDSLKSRGGASAPPVIFYGKDANGLTPLHKAAGLGKNEIAEFLVEQFPKSLNSIDVEGRTPLHYSSILKDNGQMYNFLMENGADESILDNKQKTAAYYKNRPSDIDPKLLTVIPECPRCAKENFANNFDWGLLSGATEDAPRIIKKMKDISNNNNQEPETNGHQINGENGHVSEEETNNNESNGFGDEILEETEQESQIDKNIEPEDEPVEPEDEDNKQEYNEQEDNKLEDNEQEDNKQEDNKQDDYEQEKNEELSPNKEDNEETNNNESENIEKSEEELIEDSHHLSNETKNSAPTSRPTSIKMLSNGNPGNETDEEEYEENPYVPTHLSGQQENENIVATEDLIETEEKSTDNKSHPTKTEKPNEEEEEGVIEGIVNEENEAENEDGSSKQDDESDILALVESGNMEKLAAIVLNGKGEQLIGKSSENAEIQAFLDNVPIYMGKIKRIHEAARGGSLRDLQAALDRRKFAIAKDHISPNSASPLHVAIIFGNTSVVRYLAGRFPETLQVTDSNGRTPLHYAATLADNSHYYNLLVHLGGDTRVEDKFEHTPEYYRTNRSEMSHKSLLGDFGETETFADEMLSDKDSKLLASNQVDMPFFATEEGRYLASSLGDPLIKGLTEVANKRPNDPIAYLATYLYNFANTHKKRPQTQENLQATVDPPVNNAEIKTVPTTIDVVTVEPGDDENGDDSAFNSTSRDEHGQSMLHFAAARAHGRNALFQLLLETEINVAYRDELYRTARDISIQANIPENTVEIDRYVLHIATKGDTDKLVELLLDGYDHITDISDEDNTPIFEAVSNENQNDTLSFLQSILTFEEKRERVHHAIRKSSIRDLTELLADENDTGSGKLLAIGKNSYGRCSLHIAVLCQDEEIVDYIANNFTDTLRVGDNLERTALHYAMGVEKMEILSKVLIKAGANRVAKDLKGRQPTYYYLNKVDIIKLQEEEETF